MDKEARWVLYLIILSTWGVLLYGVVLALTSGRLVIDTQIFNVALGAVVTMVVGFASARAGVNIHKGGQQQTGGTP